MDEELLDSLAEDDVLCEACYISAPRARFAGGTCPHCDRPVRVEGAVARPVPTRPGRDARVLIRPEPVRVEPGVIVCNDCHNHITVEQWRECSGCPWCGDYPPAA